MVQPLSKTVQCFLQRLGIKSPLSLSHVWLFETPWTVAPQAPLDPGEGTGYPLQYSCLENPMDRGAPKIETIQIFITDEWINKMWCIPIMDYCLAIKWDEVLIHATTWNNLESIRLRESGKSPRLSIMWFHLYEIYKVGRPIAIESRLVVEACGDGRDKTINGHRFSLWSDENVLKLDGGDSCTTLWVY